MCCHVRGVEGALGWVGVFPRIRGMGWCYWTGMAGVFGVYLMACWRDLDAAFPFDSIDFSIQLSASFFVSGRRPLEYGLIAGCISARSVLVHFLIWLGRVPLSPFLVSSVSLSVPPRWSSHSRSRGTGRGYLGWSSFLHSAGWRIWAKQIGQYKYFQVMTL